MAFQPGQSIHNNQYVITRELGEGGFGTTYLAHDTQNQREVVIKVSGKGNTNDNALLDEIDTLKQLRHKHLPECFGRFFESGNLCLCMEYIPGNDLTHFISNNTPDNQVVAWMNQILEILVYLHAQQLIHRDIKPVNTIIHRDTNEAYLIDFGISQNQGIGGKPINAGTPPYAPPEQHRGESTTAASDVYAVGVVFYELLTGFVIPTAPKRQQNPLATLSFDRQGQPIPEELQRIIVKATDLDPGQRYQNGQEMLEALKRTQTVYQRTSIFSPEQQRITQLETENTHLKKQIKDFEQLETENTHLKKQIKDFEEHVLVSTHRSSLFWGGLFFLLFGMSLFVGFVDNAKQNIHWAWIALLGFPLLAWIVVAGMKLSNKSQYQFQLDWTKTPIWMAGGLLYGLLATSVVVLVTIVANNSPATMHWPASFKGTLFWTMIVFPIVGLLAGLLISGTQRKR